MLIYDRICLGEISVDVQLGNIKKNNTGDFCYNVIFTRSSEKLMFKILLRG